MATKTATAAPSPQGRKRKSKTSIAAIPMPDGKNVEIKVNGIDINNKNFGRSAVEVLREVIGEELTRKVFDAGLTVCQMDQWRRMMILRKAFFSGLADAIREVQKDIVEQEATAP